MVDFNATRPSSSSPARDPWSVLDLSDPEGLIPVSYTHLDVYKRQVPQEFVAVHDSFGESGKPDELLTKYGLGSSNIIAAAKVAISRKK